MKTLIVIVGIAILGVLGWNWYSRSESAQSPQNTVQKNETAPKVAVKEFSITAKNFEFSEKEIRVKQGDKVKINLTSTEGTHDWVIDEFTGAKTSRINIGGSSSVEFVADKVGTFEYYCSIGTHRQMGMVGRLIVE